TLLRNFKASANSKNPSVIFTLFSQPPEDGRLFKRLGNIAKSVNGIANANAKASIPMAGPKSSPIVAACTSKVPIIGPVQEKDTTANVAAIKKSPNKLPRSALRSNLFASEAGSESSNAPKKEKAKTTKRTKNAKLKIPFVDRLLSASAPNITVIRIPNRTSMSIIDNPYIIACITALPLVCALLVKKLTVKGSIGKMQGISNAAKPPIKPAIKIAHKEPLS